jgi:hypothetical protein
MVGTAEGAREGWARDWDWDWDWDWGLTPAPAPAPDRCVGVVVFPNEVLMGGRTGRVGVAFTEVPDEGKRQWSMVGW